MSVYRRLPNVQDSIRSVRSGGLSRSVRVRFRRSIRIANKHITIFILPWTLFKLLLPDHIFWLDVLRLVAILMVIAIHCTDPFNASPESRANPEFNFWGSVYGSMLRASVPLFVMMTGFLLLPVRQEASTFYKKRIPRVPDLVCLV